MSIVYKGMRSVLAPPEPKFKVYGVRIDETNSNPETALTYTDDAVGMSPSAVGGGYNAWDETDIFKDIKPCLFQSGAVIGYLNKDNYAQFENGTAADITSGTAGNVMIEIPKMAYMIFRDGNYLNVKVTRSPNAKDIDPAFCYYGHTRETEGDRDNLYVGAYLSIMSTRQCQSRSGVTPTASTSLANFRNSISWMELGYDVLSFYPLTLLQCLYIIRFKNLNSQAALGRGYVDGNSASIVTGGTNTKGMYFGETTGKQQIKCFGIEDLWGNLRQVIDGCFCNSSRATLTAFNNFNDSGSGYNNVGIINNTNTVGYIRKAAGTNNQGFLIQTLQTAGPTYYSDKGAWNVTLQHFCCGGSFAASDDSGMFHAYAIGATTTNPQVGARLMYL